MSSRILICAAALSLLAACSGKKTDNAAAPAAAAPAAAEAPAAEVVTEREHVDRNAAGVDLTPAQKVGGVEGRSPFEGDRVIALNAIVRRSLDTMREFDQKAPAVRADVAAAVLPGASSEARAKAEEGVAAIGVLYDQAKEALDDMAIAETDLRASGEYFDDAIFYGMSKFTQDVELEIGEEKAALAAKLGG